MTWEPNQPRPGRAKSCTRLFNYRYNAELPTVITTSDPLDAIDPRIRSRMTDSRMCDVYAITVPAFRGVGRASPEKPVRRGRRTAS